VIHVRIYLSNVSFDTVDMLYYEVRAQNVCTVSCCYTRMRIRTAQFAIMPRCEPDIILHDIILYQTIQYCFANTIYH
jgi:hypothetical protein